MSKFCRVANFHHRKLCPAKGLNGRRPWDELGNDHAMGGIASILGHDGVTYKEGNSNRWPLCQTPELGSNQVRFAPEFCRGQIRYDQHSAPAGKFTKTIVRLRHKKRGP